jgi:predicted acylesterase/phospholipase RssA
MAGMKDSPFDTGNAMRRTNAGNMCGSVLKPFLILVTILSTSCVGTGVKNIREATLTKARSGTAILITGAAARIPQEAALLEELELRGLFKDVAFISGVSSGALNSVMLNGILSGKMKWDEYKGILFKIKNDDIFIKRGNTVPVDTSSARKLYTRIAEERLGYSTIGDLPFVTAISITRLRDLGLQDTVYRMFSRQVNAESDTSLSLVDILMASSAVPLVFPSIHIRNVRTIPDVEYVDGGVKEDNIPYRALLEFEKFRGFGVEKVFIISKKSNDIPSVSEELKNLGINDHQFFDKLGVSFDTIMNKKFEESLEEFAASAPDLVPAAYVYRPDFERNFLLFNFDNLEAQYAETSRWAKLNDPKPLAEYLAKYRKKTGSK